jgi:hypothetical protein
MKKIPLIISFIFLLFASQAFAIDTFERFVLDTIVHDKNLLIGGVAFRAESFCTDYQMGDQLIFLSGDPAGDCTQATVLNLRTDTPCDLWCPTPI